MSNTPDNVTNALLLEHLKAIQAKPAEHGGQFLSIESRLTALDGHVSALVRSSFGQIERGPDLVEG